MCARLSSGEVKLLFPDPRQTDKDGILCLGGDLQVETLREAYQLGIFPWPHPGLPLLWFSPVERGILEFSDVHISRSLAKFQRHHPYKLTIDTAFAHVIKACSVVPRPGQRGTWITDEMQQAYLKFHQAGYAHSVECWDGSELVGGLYGVYVENVFSGESMFHYRDNASKLCLLELIRHLRGRGCAWMDIQMVTPVLEDIGGKYIFRDEYLQKLEQAHRERPRPFFTAEKSR